MDAFRGNFADINPGVKLSRFFRGTIVDTADPLQRGRVRIRIFGIHTAKITKEGTEGIPDNELPWAEQVAPTMGGSSGAGSFSIPTTGSIVWGFFANGDPRYPMYFGVQMGMTAGGAGGGGSGDGGGSSDDGPINTDNQSNVKGICELAKKRGYDPCVLQAVSVVESGGRSGLLSDGKPVIRFESHWFAKRIDSSTKAQLAGNKELVSSCWQESIKYKGGWNTYDKAAAINPNAAFDSTSWGKYQIMGDYWKQLGYSSRDEMKAAASDANRQEELLDRFITMKGKKLDNAIKNKNFWDVATYYNGSNQAAYSSKIDKAYKQCVTSGGMKCDAQSETPSNSEQSTAIKVTVL